MVHDSLKAIVGQLDGDADNRMFPQNRTQKSAAILRKRLKQLAHLPSALKFKTGALQYFIELYDLTLWHLSLFDPVELSMTVAAP
jgi:hypothetical protein